MKIVRDRRIGNTVADNGDLLCGEARHAGTNLS